MKGEEREKRTFDVKKVKCGFSLIFTLGAFPFLLRVEENVNTHICSFQRHCTS